MLIKFAISKMHVTFALNYQNYSKTNIFMQIEKLKEIEGRLLHGGKAEIARKADVSIFTVMRFFKGTNQNKKVLIATCQYLSEIGTSIEQLENMACA